MKKLIIITLSLVTVFTVFACRNKNMDIMYKDGTYEAQSEDEGYGYEKAIVVIKNGRIDSIDLKRMDANGNEVDYDEWDGTQGGKPNLKEYRITLANEIKSKQSTKGVDAIAGATSSTEKWIMLVEDCLEQAEK